MATKDEINTKELPAFSSTKAHEQMAISMRAEGKTYQEVTNTINAEFNLAYKVNSVMEWFYSGGRLEAAYLEYLAAYADQSLKMARLKIKSLQTKAADTLEDLLGSHVPSNVRQQAARTVLNKFIPDRQIVSDNDKDDIPPEIGAAGDSVMEQNANDVTPESPGTGQAPGAGGS